MTVEPIPPELLKKLAEYRERRNFKTEEWIDAKIDKFIDYLDKNGLRAAVISLSGGVDSAVTLGLLKRAFDRPNSPLKRIAGIAQPIHSSEWALRRAQETSLKFGVELFVVDQTELHDQLVNIVESATGMKGNVFSNGQLRSYQRTPVAYYVSQLISQQGTPCVVMGTGNQDEDGYLCYFCKAGDGVVDIQLISDLHKSEVFKVGWALGVPESTLLAPPSADLWEGHTDEEELGFSYDFVELFTGAFVTESEEKQREFVESLSPVTRSYFEKAAHRCRQIHARNKHKLAGPINLTLLNKEREEVVYS
jgi:NAD+ synthase (glutamine-hydrolysing)